MPALAGAAAEFFRWKFSHPHESEDPSAVWGAAWRAGARAAVRDTAHLSDMTPLLRELLCLVEDGRVEDVLRATDRRPRPADEEEDAMTAGPQVPAGGQPMPLTGMGRDSLPGLSDPATQDDLQQMRALQVTLVLQLDQTDASLRRLRWYVLTLAILVLCLCIVVFVTTVRLLP